MSEHSGQTGSHVTVGTYLRVALILAVVTAVEFGIVYVDALKPVVKPILIILSAYKFGMVALYFMHLKFDRRVLSGFFFAGLALAIAIVLSVSALINLAG